MFSKSLLFVFILKRWRVLRMSWENHFTALESPGKVLEFFVGKSVGMLFVFIFKRWRAPRRSWENHFTVPESPGKDLEFSVGKSVGT